MLDRFFGHRPDARVAVWFVVTVALVSIVTGVVAIVTEPVVEGPGAVGLAQSISEFSGTVVGFALLMAAWAMFRGYRLAYVAAAVLVALSAAHGIAQSRLVSLPLVVLSITGLVVLLLTSPRFTRSSSFTPTQVGAILATVGVCGYGTAGAYALQDGFEGVDTVLDAFYFTLATASTVGYGDVHATSEAARLFAVSLIVLGPAAVAVALGSVLEPALEARFSISRETLRADGGSSRVPDRVVVLGCGPLVGPALSGLAGRVPVAIVTADERARILESDGVDIHRGEPADEATLQTVGLEGGDAVLVATGSDLETAHAVLAASSVAPDVHVVAFSVGDVRATRLERAGADSVIDPRELLENATAEAVLEMEAAQN